MKKYLSDYKDIMENQIRRGSASLLQAVAVASQSAQRELLQRILHLEDVQHVRPPRTEGTGKQTLPPANGQQA